MKIKEKLLKSKDLLERIQDAFDNLFFPFSEGTSVELYKIGLLDKESHLALRCFSDTGENSKINSLLQIQMLAMEEYCLNAEELKLEKKRVPNFCVGVIYGNLAGIITQDLTFGGTREFKHNFREPFGYLEGSDNPIYIDIDGEYRIPNQGGFKYFLEKNRISLVKPIKS
jgi:hypothetical protein